MNKAERHMHNMQEAFELFDTDSSGTIDEREFTRLLKNLVFRCQSRNQECPK